MVLCLHLPKTPAAICFKNGISVISAHTNYDLSPIGVNKVLAQKLNLHNVVSSNDSCFMIGELDKPMTSDMFSEYVGKCLSAHLRYNDCTKEIKTVAVCGGAGSDFASDAKKPALMHLLRETENIMSFWMQPMKKYYLFLPGIMRLSFRL